MVMATLRPRSAPSESLLLEMVFSTGECWATQSILRCPSGARAGFFITDSRIIAPPTLVLRVQFTGLGDESLACLWSGNTRHLLPFRVLPANAAPVAPLRALPGGWS